MMRLLRTSALVSATFLFLLPANQGQTPMTAIVNWLGNAKQR